VASHTRTVLTSDPEAIFVPSGLKLTDVTLSLWPSIVDNRDPVVASHTRTVLSYDPEAIFVPSGLKLTDVTY